MEESLCSYIEVKRLYKKLLQNVYKLAIKQKKVETNHKKGLKKLKKKKKKKASSPEQDLHPDWDRFRGTMLYPLSCGELAIIRE